MKLVKHIANLGYGSRKQVQWLFREGRVTDADGEVLYADDAVPLEAVRIDGDLRVIYSPYDLACAWSGCDYPLAQAYEQATGVDLGMNLLLYAMTH